VPPAPLGAGGTTSCYPVAYGLVSWDLVISLVLMSWMRPANDASAERSLNI